MQEWGEWQPQALFEKKGLKSSQQEMKEDVVKALFVF